MRIFSSIRAFVIASTLLVSMSASASLVFNFEQDLSDFQHSIDYSMGGYTLTVEAFDTTDSFVNNVFRSSNGLGVSGQPDGGNFGAGESLSFSLDTTLFSLLEIDFRVYGSDSATVTLFGGVGESFVGERSLGKISTFSMSNAGINSFSVAHSAGLFRIAEVRFLEGAVSVPSPSILSIFLIGLVGIGFVRSRNNKI